MFKDIQEYNILILILGLNFHRNDWWQLIYAVPPKPLYIYTKIGSCRQ